MANFKFDTKGMADLKRAISQDLKRAESEANKAADKESTPAGKARVFARVLRRYGVQDVNERELRRKFGG